MSYIRIANISKTYAAHRAFADVTLSLGKGRITAIAGASGSGKTSLLKAIYGLIALDSGTVYLEDERVLGPNEKLIPGHDRMKLVDQQFELNWYASVWDNVAAQLPNTDLKIKSQRTEWLLHRMRISELKDKRVNDLSGGEKQRVAIAKALATYPDVLLLDEPFNQVDTSFRDFLQQDIRNYVRENGLTVVLVSHDPAEVLSMADELIVIRDGFVLEKGSPQQLYNHPQNSYTAQLLGNANLLNNYGAKQCGIRTNSELVAVYPEWIKTHKGMWGGKIFKVKEVLYKGFFEQLILEKDDVQIRAMNTAPGHYQIADSVHVSIRRYIKFDGKNDM